MKTAAVEPSLGVSEADIPHFPPPLSFRPLHNQVVIRVLEEKRDPDALVVGVADPRKRSITATGIIVAKGEGHRRRVLQERGKDRRNPLDGARYGWLPGYSPLPVEVGDTVLCARNMGEHHIIDGESYLVTPVEHIFGVLEGFKAETVPATEREFGMTSFLDKKYGRPASARPIVAGKHA
jgi:co-chaperonin GroES (HSP10)